MLCKYVGQRLVLLSPGEEALRLAEEQAWAAGEAERTACRERIRTDKAECLQAKLDTAVMALVNATPEQLITYARNNFPSLTLAEQNKIGTILYILAVAVRPQVR